MKKLFWVMAAVALCFGGSLIYFQPEGKAQGTQLVQQKKKKTKHNYRSLTSSTVTGDENNGDVGALMNSWLTYQTFYYRKIPVPGLSLGDPFPLRIVRKADSVSGFEEEHWGGASYFISEGNVWVNYGYKVEIGANKTTSFTTTGDYRIFSYNGGTRKKATKRKALAVYDINLSGDESNADATAVFFPANPNTTYYYRKFAIPKLKMANLADYRIMQKSPFYQGINEDYWHPAPNIYFITDDYLYLAYGSKFGSTFSTLYFPYSVLGDYKFYLYSDGKMKKKKLTKQYVKRYVFNVPGGESAADKVSTSTNGPFSYNYYYKKVTIPGLRMADQYNMKVMKKNSFTSGYSGESWSEGSFYVTDGALWISYGSKMDSSAYVDTGAGDYQVFLYK
ncbi:MAG: hypothetical protein V1690_03420 [Candidatus Moraniibacteriota bacterium]